MERTSKLERILFKAVRILMLVAALLALLAAAGLGINGLIKSNASSNETIKAPTVSFEAYTDQLAREKAAQDSAKEKAARDKATAGEGEVSSEKKPAQRSEPEQFPAKYRDVLNDIEKSIANYAQKTGQPSPTETLRRNLYLEAESRFGSFGLMDDFFSKLTQLGNTLDAAGDELRTLDDSDPRKIFWGKFLDYVYDHYRNDLSQQVDAVNRAKREAEMTRMLAPAEYTKAYICLGAFFVLTLLLVLLNIEKNTYIASMVLRSAFPDAYREPDTFLKKRRLSGSQPGTAGETAS